MWIGLIGADTFSIPFDIVERIPESQITWRLRIINPIRWRFENYNSLSFLFKQTPKCRPKFFSFFNDCDDLDPSLTGAYEVTKLPTVIRSGDTIIFSPGSLHIEADICLNSNPPVTSVDYLKIINDISRQ
jgi:hypothetical protein